MEPIRAKLKGLREWEGRIVAFVPIVRGDYGLTDVVAVFVCDDGAIFWAPLDQLTEIKKVKGKP